MPRYVYKAKRGPDQTLEGQIEAVSREAAVASLDAMGYIPISVQEAREKGSIPLRFRQLWRKASARDVTVFTYQLASLTRAGVPILRALSTIAEQTESPALSSVIEDVRQKIQDGGMLSDSMSRHPAVFPEIYVSMIRSGESAGRLDAVLQRMAETREKEEEVRRRVQAALAYPALILVVGVGTVFVLLAFFLPRVAALFKDFRHLPLPTRILIGISEFFSNHWPWMLILVLLGAAVLARLMSREKGRLLMDRVQLRLPLIGRFMLHAEIARFARTLAMLIEAGVSIEKALVLSEHTFHNHILRKEMEDVRVRTVRQGATLSSGLRKAAHMPALIANMTAVGEEAGRLEESLGEVAALYERDCDQQSRLMVSLLEPALILGIGGVVGFIVAAMLLPIFRLSSGL
jgi:type II secretory pathway component PulF